jgi:hypothetical protein
MSENDVNKTQVVTETEDVNREQVVTAPGENAEAATQQADKTVDSQNAVPYDRFKEVNDAKKAAEEQAAYAQRQLELMQQMSQQQAQPTAPTNTMEQAMSELGLTADDLWGENLLKLQARKDQLDTAQRQQAQAVMSSQQFLMSHPDANQVVGSVNLATGQILNPSAELLAILAKKPYLAGACTPEGAYDIVMQERKIAEFEKTQQVANEQITRQKVENAIAPLGGSAAGGGSTGAGSNTGLMTREQIAEINRRLDLGETI